MRLLIVSLCFALYALIVSGAASTNASTAHPCRLISDGEVARIIGAKAHVAVGGSTCRVILSPPPDIGVITINPDTLARFAAFRRQASASPAQVGVTNVPGLGQSAFFLIRKGPQANVPHSLVVFQRGNRLVVTAFARLRKSIDPTTGDEVYHVGPSPLTRAAARRIAALVASRI
jgi:hypothetical protein